eukprot:scaffold7114_cov18-Tisochrysis_lutea.AAC.1
MKAAYGILVPLAHASVYRQRGLGMVHSAGFCAHRQKSRSDRGIVPVMDSPVYRQERPYIVPVVEGCDPWSCVLGAASVAVL